MSAVVIVQGSRDFNAGEASSAMGARKIAMARGYTVVSAARSNAFRNSHGPNAWVVRVKAKTARKPKPSTSRAAPSMGTHAPRFKRTPALREFYAADELREMFG